MDGVALGQPAVALAAKLTSRTARAGLPPELLPSGPGVGEQLFALAAAAKLAGVDPEAELRAAALASPTTCAPPSRPPRPRAPTRTPSTPKPGPATGPRAVTGNESLLQHSCPRTG